MKVVRIRPAFEDERGQITDILAKEEIQFVTLITQAKGTTRGNHYHKETVQWNYVLQGKLKLLTQFPDSPVISTLLEVGDLAVTEQQERHALEALEDSVFLVFTRGVRGGTDYEKDTYRLTEPLQEGHVNA
ncbi:MAG TPA: cupin domain-containing protein [Pyrinomonadaceae bacterium]|jgi:quercetin dioxygenase-like cupin family protein|nr:cupin domain-containing protein [Pyrinomonadaceae bacterium]